MAAPTSLLGQARAFARDFPRDRMPAGYLWDVSDYVPSLIDAALTGRGGWQWGSTLLPSSYDPQNGILATFPSGDRLLVVGSTSIAAHGRFYDVLQDAPYTATDIGAAAPSLQNMVMLGDAAISVQEDGFAGPQVVRVDSGGTFTIVEGYTGDVPVRRAVVYKSMFVSAAARPPLASVEELRTVRFSVPGFPIDDHASWDPNSFIKTSKEVTALAALRTMVIVFHRGSAERIRGSTPPRTPPTPLPEGATELDYIGDMILEPLFEDLGCYEPKTIAYWNDSVLFANERGLHMSDGSTVVNLASQGGIRSYWRQVYADRASIAGAVFLDYYLLTIIRNDGTHTTLVCDLPRRQWFRFTNIPALTFITSGSTANVDRLWAGLKGTNRLARLGPCFFPDLDVAPISDDNGVPVLPAFETPWYRLGNEGRKRIRFCYLSYDARLPGMTPALDVGYITSPQQPSYVSAGALPSTDEYERFRLPVGKFPYGIAFKVAQTVATRALRIFDLGIEASASERSRV